MAATSFIFLDECISKHSKSQPAATGIASITGVIVPVERYAALREQFYETRLSEIVPRAGTISFPKELHGKDLMREHSDDAKLEQVGKVADLLLRNGVRLCRVGYRLGKQVEQTIGDAGVIQLCWLKLLMVLRGLPEPADLIPVMDMTEDKKLRDALAFLVRSGDVVRAAGATEFLGIPKTEGILGEMLFADSASSVFVQTADLVSYMLHASDQQEQGAQLTQFKAGLAATAARLEPLLILNAVITMRWLPDGGIDASLQGTGAGGSAPFESHD